MPEKMHLTDAEWRAKLTPEQYQVLRQAGTERAFTGKYEKNKAAGEYLCAGCGQPLFESDAKFDSGSGWPSFVRQIRLGHRLAELYPGDRSGEREGAPGPHGRRHRGALGAGRQSSRPRVSGRTAGPRRIALLHQLGGA